MGWSYRKSMSFGPFRVNVGKRGVGYSIGGKGFRTGVSSTGRRYSSYSLPGTGLRYTTQGGRTGAGCAAVLFISLAAGVGSVAGYALLREILI